MEENILSDLDSENIALISIFKTVVFRKRYWWLILLPLFLLSCQSDEEHKQIPFSKQSRTIMESSEILNLKLTDDISIELVKIPPGEFYMGEKDSPKELFNKFPEEKAHEHWGMQGHWFDRPYHKVTISKPFYMGKYEVTQEQYECVMGENPSRFKGKNNPVEKISWYDAQLFCRKLSEITGNRISLPTEAQWEYACRAGTTTLYYFGNDKSLLNDYAWNSNNSGNKTHVVGQKKPNSLGLYDMYGNVGEWCRDWYGDYQIENVVDPEGPDQGFLRVVRGGHFNGRPKDCSSIRAAIPPDAKTLIGLRIVINIDSCP